MQQKQKLESRRAEEEEARLKAQLKEKSEAKKRDKLDKKEKKKSLSPFVLQAQQAILQQALHKAAETRQAYAEMRDRKSESERRAHTPSAASAPRRRRRRPEVGA